MFIIKLQGGLGNQMFQYAFASIISKNKGCILKLDKSFLDNSLTNEGFTYRPFELSIFRNANLEASTLEIQTLTKSCFYCAFLKKFGLYKSKIYIEPSLDYHPEAMFINPPMYIKGYFQSYKYFENNIDYIKDIFTFSIESLNEKNYKLLSKLKSMISISVHIRRGDYITNKKAKQFHGNLSFKYYLKAIDIMASKNKVFTLVFFSDDIKWVKEKFQKLPYSKVFIDYNKNENAWIDMLLMSSCSHNIIANSSFSWWAAFLNNNPEKIVIAPKKWYADPKINTNNLVPIKWIRL